MNTVTSNVIVAALHTRQTWAATQGDRPLWPNGPTAAAYVAGFVRAPGMGSYVTNGYVPLENLEEIEVMLAAADWQPVDPGSAGKVGYKYYQAAVPPGYTAYEAVAQLSDLTEDELKETWIRKGPHGLELVLPGKPREVNTMIAIVDNDGLVTWYPGRLTPSVDLASATVKLV